MSIIKSITNAIGGTLADQWKDVITAGTFDERSVVMPGLVQDTNKGRGVNRSGSQGVISNGSKILIPENTAAFIFSQSGIEEVISAPGEYVYQNGQASVFDGDGFSDSIFEQIGDRIGFGGKASEEKSISFVNLREIRGIRFGTRSPLMYNDLYYGVDLELTSFGAFSLKIVDAERFVRNFVPANVRFYSFDDDRARDQVCTEFLQSFIVAINSLSQIYRISQLPAQAGEIAKVIQNENANAGTWSERFGFEITSIGIESIEFSAESKELVKNYSAKKMDWKAYDSVSQQS